MRIVRLRRQLSIFLDFFFSHLVFFITISFLSLTLLLGFKIKDFFAQVGLGQVNFLNFFRSPQQFLESTNNQTNFLLLGIRGEGSDSPDLTDTMIIISYSHATKLPAIISIPRDLWVSSLKTKINSVYHYGHFQDPENGGIKLVQGAVLETLGLPIHYVAVIDFSIFQRIIDLVGGVDVDVKTAFVDNQFPLPGKENAIPVSSRYETISFRNGLQHMDSISALKFVRSRHADGQEGSDIARDRRQQQVIDALKQRIISPNFLLSRHNLAALFDLLDQHLESNLDKKLYPVLARLALDSHAHSPKKIILSYEPDEDGVTILESPPISPLYQDQWVLVAKDRNWKALAQYLQNKINSP